MHNVNIWYAIIGWLLLFIYLVGQGFYYRWMSAPKGHFQHQIWKEKKVLMDGAVHCLLTTERERDRKKQLKNGLIKKIVKQQENEDHFTYYFNYDKEVVSELLTWVIEENKCCPFFGFTISILPSGRGVALQMSGSKAALDVIRDFWKNTEE